MHNFLSSLPRILPTVYAWAEEQEAMILKKGLTLTESQLADARSAGVNHPEKIRVLLVEEMPRPENEHIMFLAKQIGLFSTRSVGLALGYGIYLSRDLGENRETLVHECVHVRQYEKLLGIRPFLAEYLRECIEPGYPFGHLEQEAIWVAQDICKTPPKK